MSVAIVIGSVSRDSPWLADCVHSLVGCHYPVHAHFTRQFELDTIGWAAKQFDEFVFLPESTVVLDQQVFDWCFEEFKGSSVNLGTAQGLRFRMYLGKYRAEPVNMMGVPEVRDKWDAVNFESSWCLAYASLEAAAGRLVDFGGPLEHTTNFVERHGRRNMVVENEYLRRFKGSYDHPSVEQAVERIAAGGI